MSNSPNANPDPNNSETPSPTTPPLWKTLLWRGGLVVGSVAIAGIVGGAAWAWVFINRELAPTIAQQLSKTLNRPVEVGDLERFSLNGLRLGASGIPATASDPDRAEVEAIDVGFDLFKLIRSRTLSLDLTLVEPTAYLEQNAEGDWVDTEITLGEPGPIKTEVSSVKLQDATVVLSPKPEEEKQPRQPIQFEQIDGKFNILEGNNQIRLELSGKPEASGQFNLKGNVLVEQKQVNVLVRSQDMPVVELSRVVKSLVNLPVTITAGQANTNLTVRYKHGPDALPHLLGDVRVKDLTAKIDQVPQPFSKTNGRLRFKGQLGRIEKGNTFYGKIPVQAGGSIHVRDGFNITAQVKEISIPDALETLAVPLPVPVTGDVKVDLKLTGKFDQPVLSGQVENLGIVRADRIDVRSLKTDFLLAAPKLQLSNIRVLPVAGGQITGQGQLKLDKGGGIFVDLIARNLPGDAIAKLYGIPDNSPIRVGDIQARTQVVGPLTGFRILTRWEAPAATYPARGEVLIAGGNILLRNTVASVAGGTVKAAANIDPATRRWQARVQGAQIHLDRFSRQLQGQFSGNFQLFGGLDSFDPTAIRAVGQARFSQGLSLMNRPLTTQVRWNGQRLYIDRANAPGLSANGWLQAKLTGANAPDISDMNLNVQLSNYDLQTLPLADLGVPDNLKVQGSVDFAGKVRGNLAVPRLMGAVRLQRFAVNQFAFDPILSGNVQFVGKQGANLNLDGVEDRIALVLDRHYMPVSFEVRQDNAIATGRSTGNRQLFVDVANFPIASLNIAPAKEQGLGPVSGKFSGQFDVNLADLQNIGATGEFAVANPSLGYIAGKQFAGRLRYVNGVASLTDGELIQGDSRYLVSANVFTAPELKFDGAIEVAKGRLQDVQAALQWFDFPDIARGVKPPVYDSATDLNLVSVGDPDAPLITQLRRFSEIRALLDQQQQQREDASPLPSLTEIAGTFDGKIDFAGSLSEGIGLDFNLKGENWNWGEYVAQQVTINGGLEDGILTLVPFRFESGDTLLAFSGQIGGDSQSGQLQVENVPVEPLRELANLPLDITGKLNATATLSGSFNNPSTRGEISLVDGTLSQEPIRSAIGSFSYRNARLDFGSTISISETEPIIIGGSLPYKLPFANVAPKSIDIALNVDVKNEGLSLLNLVNDQVVWEGGEGEVQLKVSGNLLRPVADGSITLNNAKFSSPLLPEPVTEVNSRISFNTDRIVVRELDGKFSDGKISAAGVLPIFGELREDDADRAKPLTVNLTELAMDLKGLYRGGVDGKVVLTGTAIAPLIGGEILLANGQVFLPENAGATAPATNLTAAEFATSSASEPSFFSPPELNNLDLELGKNILIVRPPILNFRATGNLMVSGPMSNLRPDGTIRLRSGQVNLFTTQFTLARGHEHTATFEPANGLDPFLDVRMNATVTEATRPANNTTDVFSNNEINESFQDINDLGSARTILVQAKVEGLASQLFDELELTSRPDRGETEIVALLGGSFVDTFGRGDTTLGLANLAGSVLLTNIQNFIGDALGLSDFRLFPTTILSRDDDDNDDDEPGQTLGLGAELGFNVTRDLSVSVLRILTAGDQPTQFNVRYRINDEFLLRTSTDFSGDTRAVVEYEARF